MGTRVVYNHLLRQRRTIGIEHALVAIQPLSIALRVGQMKVRHTLRSLDTKDCIKIENRTYRRPPATAGQRERLGY